MTVGPSTLWLHIGPQSLQGCHGPLFLLALLALPQSSNPLVLLWSVVRWAKHRSLPISLTCLTGRGGDAGLLIMNNWKFNPLPSLCDNRQGLTVVPSVGMAEQDWKQTCRFCSLIFEVNTTKSSRQHSKLLKSQKMLFIMCIKEAGLLHSSCGILVYLCSPAGVMNAVHLLFLSAMDVINYFRYWLGGFHLKQLSSKSGVRVGGGPSWFLHLTV